MVHVDIFITASKDQVGQPWLWRLGKEFNVIVNVRKAAVDEDYGWVQIELEGPVEDIQRATAWLMTSGMSVEAKQRALGV
jgi:hypothetical protein